MTDRTRAIRNGDVTLATETAGEPTDPPVLLIMGAAASMLWWPEDFFEQLAAQGNYVIRYDHRDTGRSTGFLTGEAHYGLPDLVDDAIAVLDGHHLPAAHVIGMSMGGILAQLLALDHRDRVETLTLVSTTPLGIEGLPPMTDALKRHGATRGSVDWSDPESVTEFMLRDARALAGTRHPHDEAAAASLIARDLARTPAFASVNNHYSALEAGDAPQGFARDIAVPTLILHGTADPVFPCEHAQALADAIQGSRLHWIEGGGHELHAEDREEMLDAIHLLFVPEDALVRDEADA